MTTICDCHTRSPTYPVFRDTYHVPGCPLYQPPADDAHVARGCQLFSDPNKVKGRTAEDAAEEAERLLSETFDKLDPDHERDAWFIVRLTKIREALADRPSTAEIG